jgi:iron complex outermembrane receptor protein
VGGVINFITRRKFDGIEGKARYGFGDDYHSAGASLTVGNSWESISAFGSYDYARHDALYGRDRDYVRRLNYQTGQLLDLACAPGTVSIGATTYALPGLTAGSGNRCDQSDNRTFYPNEQRHSFFGGTKNCACRGGAATPRQPGAGRDVGCPLPAGGRQHRPGGGPGPLTDFDDT